MAEIAESGRDMTPDERTTFFARHDQSMVET